MDSKTVKTLNQLNKKFYEQVGKDFSRTRQAAWHGWKKLTLTLDRFHGEVKILDVGCGNGRFGEFLKTLDVDNEIDKWRYVGIDSSEELLNEANNKLGDGNIDFELVKGDLIETDWTEKFDDERFEVIVMFGLLHHLPGFENRKRLIKKLAKLLKPGGIMIVSAWQFDRSEKFVIKDLRLTEKAKEELAINGLEEDDYFLGWNNKPGVWRYCHLTKREEMVRLTENLGLDLIEEFEADGKNGNMNLYQIYQR